MLAKKVEMRLGPGGRRVPSVTAGDLRQRRILRPANGRFCESGEELQIGPYVAETFQLMTAAGDPVKISWVGMDAGVDSAWLYFEARLPASPDGLRLRNRFLFDLFDDQINLVNFKTKEGRTALRFERGKADFQTVSLK